MRGISLPFHVHVSIAALCWLSHLIGCAARCTPVRERARTVGARCELDSTEVTDASRFRAGRFEARSRSGSRGRAHRVWAARAVGSTPRASAGWES
eukprot:6031403-Prymnesium_polylepis.1